jgi:hypothetical protein
VSVSIQCDTLRRRRALAARCSSVSVDARRRIWRERSCTSLTGAVSASSNSSASDSGAACAADATFRGDKPPDFAAVVVASRPSNAFAIPNIAAASPALVSRVRAR